MSKVEVLVGRWLHALEECDDRTCENAWGRIVDEGLEAEALEMLLPNGAGETETAAVVERWFEAWLAGAWYAAPVWRDVLIHAHGPCVAGELRDERYKKHCAEIDGRLQELFVDEALSEKAKRLARRLYDSGLTESEEANLWAALTDLVGEHEARHLKDTLLFVERWAEAKRRRDWPCMDRLWDWACGRFGEHKAFSLTQEG